MSRCRWYEVCKLDSIDANGELCILHSKDESKDADAFLAALKTHREQNRGDFSHIVFPLSADFQGTHFSEPAVFCCARFLKDADFSKATFAQRADFRGTTFHGDVSFQDASFAAPVVFSVHKSHDEDGLRAIHTAFNGEADFWGVSFEDSVDFGAVTFGGLTRFNQANFKGYADLGGCVFNVRFMFDKAVFHQDACFLSSVFKKEARFGGAKFKGKVEFSLTKFEDSACLGADYTQEASFYSAKFLAGAHFGSARFGGNANFLQAIFVRGADFRHVHFIEGASFLATQFGDAVNFNFAAFHGPTLFSSGREEEKSVRTAVPVSEIVHVRTYQPIFSQVGADFRAASVRPPDAIVFRDADLQQCRFQDMDLRKVEFTGVTWPRRRGRNIIYDEICPLAENENRPWHRIERLYRELKQNYEDRRDYERAGDFHYGEKEMRRRNAETATFHRSLLTLYKWLSGYGEQVLPPVLWAVFLLFLCTVGYLTFGIARPSEEGATLLQRTKPEHWLETAHYSFRVMTLLRPSDLIPCGFSRFIHTFQSLAGPLVLGLFALAVRQRLKR